MNNCLNFIYFKLKYIDTWCLCSLCGKEAVETSLNISLIWVQAEVQLFILLPALTYIRQSAIHVGAPGSLCVPAAW